uniref:Replication protein RepA n=1 Tax=Xanthomonas euvesicatoria TaxID=456327 RepID=Q9RBJ8_XANEU|nr:replication protein RepA [Xanthomonas euvesicatoria]
MAVADGHGSSLTAAANDTRQNGRHHKEALPRTSNATGAADAPRPPLTPSPHRLRRKTKVTRADDSGSGDESSINAAARGPSGAARSKRNESKFIAEALPLSRAATEAGMVGYMARVLVQATMPHSKPDTNEYTRSNGNLRVSMTALSDIGSPYGSYPRLLSTWLTTEAVRTKTPTLHLGSTFRSLPTGGRWGTIPRLKDRRPPFSWANWDCGSSVVAYEAVGDSDGARIRTRGSRISVADEWDLWWDPQRFNDEASGQSGLFSSWVKLRSIYNQVVDRPVPVDLRAIAALKKSPLLDLYTFATYRVSYLNRRTEIPWKR